MEITLSPEYQKRVEQKVASGEYASLDELFSIALRPLLEEPPMVSKEAQPHDMYADTEWTIAEIERMIDESDARFERGEYIKLTPDGAKTYFENMIARLNAEFDAKQAESK